VALIHQRPSEVEGISTGPLAELLNYTTGISFEGFNAAESETNKKGRGKNIFPPPKKQLILTSLWGLLIHTFKRFTLSLSFSLSLRDQLSLLHVLLCGGQRSKPHQDQTQGFCQVQHASEQ